MKHAIWIIVALAVGAVPASADDATKEDVIKLSRAGISDKVIFAFVESRDTKLKRSCGGQNQQSVLRVSR